MIWTTSLCGNRSPSTRTTYSDLVVDGGRLKVRLLGPRSGEYMASRLTLSLGDIEGKLGTLSLGTLKANLARGWCSGLTLSLGISKAHVVVTDLTDPEPGGYRRHTWWLCQALH